MITKEWLGLRWKLAALGAIPLGMVASLLLYDATFIVPGLMAGVAGYGLVAPLFLAMHAAAEERSSGTLEFVRGLPVPLFQLGLVRVLATLTVLLVPLVANGLLVYGVVSLMSWWNPGSHFESGMPNAGVLPALALITVLGMAVAASLYLWTTALAMNQPSELRAGLVGIATLAIWGAWTLVSVSVWDDYPGDWRWMYGLTALGPFATLILFDPSVTDIGRIAIGTMNLAGACLLVIGAASRYGALERRRWPGTAQFSSPNRALWWMQWRQVWPLGGAGLAVVLLFGVALAGRGVQELYEISAIIGGAWAVVFGTTMFSAELEPQLVAFWRSRPIDPSAWFRIKYLTGVLVVLIFIDLPAVCIGQSHNAPQTSNVLAGLVCIPAVHLAIFSVAVAIACLVRQAIYAGILSMAATLFFVVLPMIVPKQGLLSAISIEAVMYPAPGASFASQLLALAIYLSFTVLVTIIATAVAHWAVEKDIAVRA
jgi:hypothetical protein